MRLSRNILAISLILTRGLPSVQAGVTFTNLVNFVAAKGAYPAAGLIQATDGNFYGTTYVGGLSGIPGYGTVFRISPDGTFSNLFSFNGTNGANPYSGLVQGTNGNFYGTTESGGTNGGYGTVFEITSAGALTPLLSFDGTNGANPEAGLVLGIDGNFYGTTSQGGTNGGYGTAFQISPAGVFSNLFSFNSANGAGPYAALIQGTNGNFYGTTLYGGTNGGYGTVFEMTPAGNLATLYSFDSTDGANPYAALMRGADGNFYGTASSGGALNDGTIFRMTPTGDLTTLYSFDNTNGANPYGSLIQSADGSFWGTTEAGGTNGDGTVFSWSPGGGLVSLISFDFMNGAFPLAGLIQGADGDFYSTVHSGALNGKGAVFRLSAPVAPVFETSTWSAGSMALSWTSVSGQNYQLQGASDLNQNIWSNLGPVVLATNGVMNASDLVPPPPSQRFYRIILLP